MATAETKPAATTAPAQRPVQLPAIANERLPYHPAIKDRFGIDRTGWRALVEAVFPNATSIESVIMALSYCKARNLDPFKRNVHIVPIWNKTLRRMVDTVWPGIGELRTTAFRTKEYAGRGDTVFGPDVTQKVGNKEITYPEWAQVTVYRMVQGARVTFAGPRVYWIETYATASHDDDTPNQMWFDRPRGQLEKCSEAAALRAAFPEEIGSDYIPEEVQHGRGGPVIDETPPQAPPRRLDDLTERLAESQESDAETTHEETAEQTSTDPGELPPFDGEAAAREIEACTTISQLADVVSRLAYQQDDDTVAWLNDRGEMRREAIRASRGQKKES